MIITALAINFICSRELATEIGDGAVHRYILDECGTIYYIFLIICYFLLSCCMCVAICERFRGVSEGVQKQQARGRGFGRPPSQTGVLRA